MNKKLRFETLLRLRLKGMAAINNLMPIPVILSEEGFTDLYKSKDYDGLDKKYITAIKDGSSEFKI